MQLTPRWPRSIARPRPTGPPPTMTTCVVVSAGMLILASCDWLIGAQAAKMRTGPALSQGKSRNMRFYSSLPARLIGRDLRRHAPDLSADLVDLGARHQVAGNGDADAGDRIIAVVDNGCRDANGTGRDLAIGD